ncbi:MAG TPA: PAS domain S-box protein [Candidatus Sulfotelmatobacter sp.]|nr:PAS domain S-box protein [Candidatus Sulfotelmatobacter sp.]
MTQPQEKSEKLAGAGALAATDGTKAPTEELHPSTSSAARLRSQEGYDTEISRELWRLNRALRALSACNQALAQATSERQLLQQICDITVGMGAYRFTWIGYAHQDDTKRVRPVAHAGAEGGYLSQIEVTWAEEPSGQGPVGTAIRENLVCVIADIEGDPRFAPWRDAALQRGYAAMIALPLRAAGVSFGALAIYSDQKGSFEQSEVEMLTEMANNLAFGINAIRSQEEGRRATAALRDAEAKYRQLVEEVPAISYVAESGARGRFLYVSPQVSTILGYRQEECLGDPRFWWDHLNPEDHAVAMLEDTWEESRAFQVEYRMRRQDGKEVWLRDEALIFRDPETGQRLTRGLLIDITERKRAEDALRESEERYRAFVEQSSEGIFRLEYDPPVPCDLPPREQYEMALQRGYVAECNDAMARLYGRNSAKELMGRPISEFFVLHDPVTQQLMEDFIRAGYRVSDQESRELDAQGHRRILRNTMAGVVEDGKWARTWGISRDVTERVHLEAQLRNAQQMEAIGRLAGGVAHDFNNILSIIMGHGELLLRTCSLDERARNGVEQIRRAADRAASLTQQLLAFSRKQVLQPKVLDLNEAVSDVQKMLARVIGEDIELVASLHPSLMPVKADPGQVEQVLMNLAINARDAMPQGGRLMMETSNLELSAEQGRELDLAAGRYVMLKVTDTGHGMDAATLPHIFEPFFTTKPMGKGTGLGLSTVYGIIKQSGGSIQVQSEVGRGTAFRVYLPVEEGEIQIQKRKAAEPAAGGGWETILIAEDEPDLRELTRIFLQDYGYKVIEAATAEEALKIADASGEPIHLLLTDVIMPGMSGRQLAERLHQRRPQTKIIYMTGYTDDMVVQHKVLEPGVHMLQKPFTRLDLARKVRSTLDGQ